MMAHSTSLQTIADHISTICGGDQCASAGTSLMVSPANTAELSQVVRYANAEGITVNPFGGGTKQGWGPRTALSLILKTNRLNKVQEHTWQDMTCIVEAGCAWSSMQESLARHGQFVALDPLWPEHATIGGIAATNDSGSLRLKYGSLRDLVIGMTVVLADGTIARTGGKVVKNVAGYDLHKLMIGAFGTLGVIAEITFRLHSLPRHTQTFTLSNGKAEPLGKLLVKILDSHLSSQALQLRSDRGQFSLDLQLASFPDVIEAQRRSLAELANSFDLSVTTTDTHVWSARQALFDQEGRFVVKATVLPDRIAPLAVEFDALGGVSVTQATGITTASLPSSACAALPDLRHSVEAGGGTLTVLESSPEINVDPWGDSGASLALMREIKQRFDPNRTLNPSRFVGGI